MSKSADAFRTISEVADWLGIPAHVLRFWESKFTQVKPVKRAGGRRYYRPADMQLLGGIRKLLHEEGMTIKGVQKIMREQGVRHVAALSPPLDSDLATGMEAELEAEASDIALDVEEEETARGQVVNFGRPAAAGSEARQDVQDAARSALEDDPDPAIGASLPDETGPEPQDEAPQAEDRAEPAEQVSETPPEEATPAPQEMPAEVAAPEPPAPHGESHGSADGAEPATKTDASPEPTEESGAPARPAPIVVDTPDDPPDTAPAPAPALSLERLARTGSVSPEAAAQYAAISSRLTALRERMGDGRNSS